jgi:hypothetical protein
LLCGDFNAPQHERENGEIITWGYLKRHGDYILKYSRQHELELGILHGLSAYDLHDVYRRLHGYDGKRQEEGWSWWVLQTEMVDNSISPCECIAGWFSPHSTGQLGYFTLSAHALLPCSHSHQATYCHFKVRFLASFRLAS